MLVVGAVLIATDVIDTGDTHDRGAPGADLAAGVRPGADATAGARCRTSTARRARRRLHPGRGRQRGRLALRPAAAGHGHRLGLRGRRRRHDPHQRPRGRGRRRGDRELRGGRRADRRRGQGRATRHRPRGAEDRPGEVEDLTPLPLGDSSKARGGRPGRGDRQPVRLHSAPSPPASCPRSQRQIEAPNGFSITQRDPDRRLDQPRQLGRSAARRPGPRDRHQLPDRHRRRPAARWASASPCRSTRPRSCCRSCASGEEIKRAYLGVEMAHVTDELAERPRPAGRARARWCRGVANGGPADKAGLRGGGTEADGARPAAAT